MDWPTKIKDIIDSGLTQARIAEICLTGQSHISGLLHRKRKQPGWELGNRINALHQQRCGGKLSEERAAA